MEDKSEYPYLGPRPGAPEEQSPVHDQIARAVENALTPLSPIGTDTPEGDRSKLRTKTPITKRKSLLTPKKPL